MTDIVDMDRIRATLGACPEGAEFTIPTRDQAIVQSVESTAGRFFDYIDTTRLKKPYFVAHFEASDPLHEEIRQQLLDGARWLTAHEDSNCAVLEIPRHYPLLREVHPDGIVAEFTGLLVSGVDGNELVEKRLLHGDSVLSFSYYVYPPSHLPREVCSPVVTD